MALRSASTSRGGHGVLRGGPGREREEDPAVLPHRERVLEPGAPGLPRAHRLATGQGADAHVGPAQLLQGETLLPTGGGDQVEVLVHRHHAPRGRVDEQVPEGANARVRDGEPCLPRRSDERISLRQRVPALGQVDNEADVVVRDPALVRRPLEHLRISLGAGRAKRRQRDRCGDDTERAESDDQVQTSPRRGLQCPEARRPLAGPGEVASVARGPAGAPRLASPPREHLAQGGPPAGAFSQDRGRISDEALPVPALQALEIQWADLAAVVESDSVLGRHRSPIIPQLRRLGLDRAPGVGSTLASKAI